VLAWLTLQTLTRNQRLRGRLPTVNPWRCLRCGGCGGCAGRGVLADGAVNQLLQDVAITGFDGLTSGLLVDPGDFLPLFCGGIRPQFGKCKVVLAEGKLILLDSLLN